MGSSWSRRDRIIRLAKLRGDKAALAIMGKRTEATCQGCRTCLYGGIVPCPSQSWSESELRALWGDR